MTFGLYVPPNVRAQQEAAAARANGEAITPTACALDELGNRLPSHDGARWISRSGALEIPEYVWHRIPEPVGWRILVMEQRAPESSKGGIAFADESKQFHDALNFIGRVIAIGPTAYRNKKFMVVNDDNRMVLPEPWVGLGDWVTYRKYTGQPVKIANGHDDMWTFRMVEDEWVDAVVPSPDGIQVYVS